LSAHPIGLFEQGNGRAHARGLNCRGNAARSCAGDHHVERALLRGSGSVEKEQTTEESKGSHFDLMYDIEQSSWSRRICTSVFCSVGVFAERIAPT
jgi:hypothetical protein